MAVIAQGPQATLAQQIREGAKALRLLNTVSDPEFSARNSEALKQPEEAWYPTTAAELLTKVCGR